MKRNRFMDILSIIAVTLLVIIVGTFLFRAVYKEFNKESDGIIVKDNVYVISNENEEEIKLIEISDNILLFERNPRYSVGDIIVSGIIDLAPNGFIRRVVRVEQADGKYIIYTENALLTDVFEELSVNKVFSLREDGLQEIEGAYTNQFGLQQGKSHIQRLVENTNPVETKYVKKLDYSTDIAQYGFSVDFSRELDEDISLEGGIGFDGWLEIEIIIENEEIEWGMAFHTKTEGGMYFECSNGKEIDYEEELYSKTIPNLEFRIHGIPIVITNEIQLNLEGEASIEGEMGTAIELGYETSNGFVYCSLDKQIEEISEKNYLDDGIMWDTEASASGKENLAVLINLESKLYGLAGLNLGAGLEEKVEGNIRTNLQESINGMPFIGCLELSVYPKIKGNIVVSEIPIIDNELISVEIFTKEFEPLWESKFETPDWKSVWEEQDGNTNELESLETEIEIEEKDIKELGWQDAYSNVINTIKDTQKYLGGNVIQFMERVFVSHEKMAETEERGGVSEPIPIDELNIYYYLEDLDYNEIPELCIGIGDSSKDILAIYSYVKEDYCAQLCLSVSKEYGPESIYICQGGIVLGQVGDGGSMYMFTGDGYVMNFSAYRAEQDSSAIIASETLSWRAIDEFEF